MGGVARANRERVGVRGNRGHADYAVARNKRLVAGLSNGGACAACFAARTYWCGSLGVCEKLPASVVERRRKA